jgi:hypothetical protein
VAFGLLNWLTSLKMIFPGIEEKGIKETNGGGEFKYDTFDTL